MVIKTFRSLKKADPNYVTSMDRLFRNLLVMFLVMKIKSQKTVLPLRLPLLRLMLSMT